MMLVQCNLVSSTAMWILLPSGGALLERVDDLSILTELTYEAFLSTQAAAENMGAGKLDHLGEEGSQFPINHLQGYRRFDLTAYLKMTVKQTLTNL